ncbi:hypothetical protein [Paenibacillus larvae]|uniref:Uncharacterized protein n=1 Tax=Paenibacillus larvae subsp. larvae DSM 25430 TaxID=697284 RepID=V9W5Y5_9BACL|nr:hypothetical protein [Paenibacillus larvae]AHD06426.1 hypothetical protein ERIC2_c26390 [Paenibacillus larvae subsp. larvae DSM 25430]AVG12973.1 hypothetical protein ERICII_02619 [Paenibacillus larvae subsp. larvae DSM 25430]MDR5569031.1 hypothetical protein [Paenibacillus larvae]MDR5596694.1 hypothetical protein [Paenibacillus larvae]
MKVYNGENIAITIVSDGNPDVSIPPKGVTEINLDLNEHRFNEGSFYILEEGDWYAKTEHCASGADIEIYLAD